MVTRSCVDDAPEIVRRRDEAADLTGDDVRLPVSGDTKLLTDDIGDIEGA